MSPRFRLLSVSIATAAALTLGITAGVGSASAGAPATPGTAAAPPAYDRGTLVEIPRTAPPTVAQTLTVPSGTVFSIALYENPTTGFLWDYSLSAGSERVVTYLDTEFVRDPASPGMVGVGGTRYFRFQAADPGLAIITLVYQRPWEQRPIQQVTLTVQVS